MERRHITPEAWSLLGLPRWHLDELPRLAVLIVSSCRPWKGSITIPQQSSESLPKKVGTEKALSKALVQSSFDRCSGHLEPEQGRKLGSMGGGE